MPITGICQPETIDIDKSLRLRAYDREFGFAFPWYQDKEMVYLMDGVRKTYSMENIGGMYRYLDEHGELYFIEVMENSAWKPIGDVTFWKEDMPIVIGDAAYRNKGIGRRVVRALIERGRELGYDELFIGEIYSYNTGSRKCFEAAGFSAYKNTKDGTSFHLKLN